MEAAEKVEMEIILRPFGETDIEVVDGLVSQALLRDERRELDELRRVYDQAKSNRDHVSFETTASLSRHRALVQSLERDQQLLDAQDEIARCMEKITKCRAIIDEIMSRSDESWRAHKCLIEDRKNAYEKTRNAMIAYKRKDRYVRALQNRVNISGFHDA